MNTASLDTILRAGVGRVPGLVAMATTATDTIYQGAFGHRDLAGTKPMTEDTIFGLASMTKALVSAGAMQLVEREKLALDAPIATVLPELAAPMVLTGFGADGTPTLRPANGPITLRQLLTHSAGYGYNTWNAEILRWLEVTGAPRMPTSSAELAAVPLLFDPGARWNYGINTDIVGKAIEAASGQRMDHFLRDSLFAPLGMADTVVEPTADQRARLTDLHARDASGALRRIDQTFGNGPAWCMGGGALLGTAGDYLRFIRMVLNQGTLDGTRVLWPRTVAEMSRNSLRPGVTVQNLATVMPERSNDAEFFPGAEKTWSTAFMINTAKADTGRNAGSLAWAGLANTYYWIDPTAGVGGVILMQLLPFADRPALDLFAAFERGVYDAIG